MFQMKHNISLFFWRTEWNDGAGILKKKKKNASFKK